VVEREALADRTVEAAEVKVVVGGGPPFIQTAQSRLSQSRAERAAAAVARLGVAAAARKHLLPATCTLGSTSEFKNSAVFYAGLRKC